MHAAPIFVLDRLHIRHVILFLFLSNSKITEIEERMVEVHKDNVPQRQTISLDMSLQLLTLHPDFNWLDHLVSSDEKWVLYKNHHRRAQWVDADKQPEDVVKQELHHKKILLSVWWSDHGVLYWELLPEGKTITANYYSSQLQKRHASIPRRPGLQNKVRVEKWLKKYFDSKQPEFWRKVVDKGGHYV
ncbi:hypothetical protein CRE_01994 [Caenorhabditis remanei]|uniref:Mos1 transposase HTH domain-containing protein n=1 Tax=Caenorhabditis remanei TaxID=31234 RepID=E3LGQ1_CAERE|nr:hypothetical protein CRE_01994 [Caenorhabditis remanei]